MLDMSGLRRLWHRFLAALRFRQLDDEFDEEARSHIALATEDFVRSGMSVADARRRARLAFGPMASSKDAHRASRGLAWLDAVLFDARMAIRGLWRDRGFALTAIVTLTIALALHVSVAMIREAMVSRGMPMARDATRLSYLSLRRPADLACCPGPVRYADFERWRAQATAFEGLAFGPLRQPIAFRAGGRLVDTTVSRQAGDLFALLGVTPASGRDFTAADEAPGAPDVVIVSHEFWMNWMAQRPDILGLQVLINDRPAEVVGVLPPRFAIVFPQDVYMPLRPEPNLESGVIGRLRAGMTNAEATRQIETITTALQADDGVARGVPLVRSYAQALISADSPRIYGALWAGVWFVLVIACANLTNLLTVRTTGRWREFATRAALGEGQVRLVRQMCAESLTLAAIAGVFAWWIAARSVRFWAEMTASRYLVLDYSMTSGMAAYLAAIAVAAAVAITLVPAARVMQLRAGDAIRSDARGATRSLRLRRLTSALVTVQMTLAIVLLLGAGVLLRSVDNIVGAETGVRDAGHVAVGLVALPSDRYATAAARLTFFDRLEARLRDTPGTIDVAIANRIPTRGIPMQAMELDGRLTAPAAREQVQVMTASPRYFATLGRTVAEGRDFAASDDGEQAPVVMVNQSFAATFWPGQTALGRRVRLFPQGVPGPWRLVVGVAPDIMHGDATRQRFLPVVYVPLHQQPAARANVFVRANAPAAESVQAVLAALRSLDGDVVTEEFDSLDRKFAFDRDWMDLEHADLGKHAVLAPVFAVVALVLSALGLVAVIAHSVSQRTKEIGVRVAIGAAAADIARMILREGMRPVAAGLVVGLLLGGATNRILESQLVGVSPYDSLTFIGGPVLLVIAALVGCGIPARRAARIDPMVALRHE